MSKEGVGVLFVFSIGIGSDMMIDIMEKIFFVVLFTLITVLVKNTGIRMLNFTSEYETSTLIEYILIFCHIFYVCIY